MSNKKEENLEEVKKVEEVKETKLTKAKTKKEPENKEKTDKEKINNIIKEAKENGKMTYSDLATKLNDVNPEKMDEVFDEFTKELSFRFDTENGILYITRNGVETKIEGFVTEFSDEKSVASDNTLSGNGKPSDPLSISKLY